MQSCVGREGVLGLRGMEGGGEYNQNSLPSAPISADHSDFRPHPLTPHPLASASNFLSIPWEASSPLNHRIQETEDRISDIENK